MASFKGVSCVLVDTQATEDTEPVNMFLDNVGVLELEFGVFTVFECVSVESYDSGTPSISAMDAVEAFAQGFALFVPVAAAIWGGRVILKLLRKG